MLLILAGLLFGFAGAYFVAKIKPHWLTVVLGFLAGLALFLVVFFGSFIVYLGILESLAAEAETRSILKFGRLFMVPIEWVPWILGSSILVSGIGSGMGWKRAKKKIKTT